MHKHKEQTNYDLEDMFLCNVDQRKRKMESSVYNYKSENKNTESFIQETINENSGKEVRETSKNVEEIVVMPDIYQSECLLTKVKSENDTSDWLSQEIKQEIEEACQNIENGPVVYNTTDRIEYFMKDLPISVQNKNNIDDSDICHTYKAAVEYNLENSHMAFLQMQNFEGKEQLAYSYHMPGNVDFSTYCVMCKKVDDMTNHKCTADYQFQCTFCGRVFKSDKYLKNHLVVHNGESNFVCNFCGKVCAREANLLSHTLIHTNDKIHSCNVCGKHFKSRSNLKTHLLIHGNDRKYICKICGKSFKQRATLYSHTLQHSMEKRHKCEVCGKCFSQSGSLHTHSLLHSDDEKKYKCDTCHKTFTQRGNLQLHLLIHTNERNYRCVMCEKTFLRKADLLAHTTVHTEAIYNCEICGQNLKHKKYLKRHMLIHTGKKKKISSIIGGSENFSEDTGNMDSRSFCVKCKKVDDLTNHRCSADYQYQCLVCNKKFKTSNSLKCHMGVHTGNSNFICKYCGKICTKRANLLSHLLVHTNEKKHICMLCGKCFKRKGNLTEHLRIHVNDKSNKIV